MNLQDWLRTMAPAPLVKEMGESQFVQAIIEPGTVANVIFNLGRRWEKEEQERLAARRGQDEPG